MNMLMAMFTPIIVIMAAVALEIAAITDSARILRHRRAGRPPEPTGRKIACTLAGLPSSHAGLIMARRRGCITWLYGRSAREDAFP